MNLSLANLRDTVERLGPAGVIGIGLLVFAAMWFSSALRPLQASAVELRAQAASLKERARGGKNILRDAKTTADQLSTFYAFFPRSETSPALLGKIQDTARAKGIVLRSGEYKLERRDGLNLVRYQITLPVTASYSQIREFIGAVLTEVPAASIDEIQMRRDSVSNPIVDARIRLSLYFGAA